MVFGYRVPLRRSDRAVPALGPNWSTTFDRSGEARIIVLSTNVGRLQGPSRFALPALPDWLHAASRSSGTVQSRLPIRRNLRRRLREWATDLCPTGGLHHIERLRGLRTCGEGGRERASNAHGRKARKRRVRAPDGRSGSRASVVWGGARVCRRRRCVKAIDSPTTSGAAAPSTWHRSSRGSAPVFRS